MKRLILITLAVFITLAGFGQLTKTNPRMMMDSLNLKLSLADTSAMLVPYINRADTAGMLTPYINRADTAAMLAPYIPWNDTLTLGSIVVARTVKVTIGWSGATGVDFNLPSDENTTESNIDLGSIVPAKARVIYVELICTEALTGSGNHEISMGVGNASSGEQFIAAASVDDLNNVLQSTAVLTDAVTMNWAAATKVWLQSTPDANWSTHTAGKWAVYVTYNDYSDL